jgi:hypothetical protein
MRALIKVLFFMIEAYSMNCGPPVQVLNSTLTPITPGSMSPRSQRGKVVHRYGFSIMLPSHLDFPVCSSWDRRKKAPLRKM